MVANPDLYKRLGFDPLNDFAPISLVAKAARCSASTLRFPCAP